MHSRIISITIAIIGTMLTACSSQSTNEMFTPPVIPVHAETVKTQDVPLHFESIGTLKPSVIVEIRPQVNGMLQEAHFKEGQFVKKGTLLFTIDSASYTIRLQETEAQLNQAKAALEIALKKVERYRQLSNKDLIPQQEWDELQSQVTKHEAQIQGDEAKVASAKLDLQHCEITAPISGRISKISIHPGNLVAAAQTTSLTTISNTNVLNVEFTLTEREFQQLSAEHRHGNYPIEICPFCSQNDVSKGNLTFLDNSFDAQTGLLHLQGKMLNDHHRFLPGQHVHVRIPIQITHDALVIPQKSVKINQQGPYVFVIKDDKTVEIRHVKIGEEIGENVVILEGLAPRELIVTEGHLRLSPGLKVEIKAEA